MAKTGRGGGREGEGKGEFYPVAGYVVWIGLFRGERERERYYDFIRYNGSV